MNIKTRDFGEISINPEEIIEFSKGIIAFEEHKKYILLIDDESPFCWLQSVEKEELSFIVINPFLFKEDYEFKLPDDVLAELEIENQEEVAVYVLMVVPIDYKKMTANLLAPLIINTRTYKAKQIIINDSNYSTKYKLFTETDRDKGVDASAGSEQKKE